MEISYIGLSSKSLNHYKFRIVFGIMTAVLFLYLWTVIPGRYYKNEAIQAHASTNQDKSSGSCDILPVQNHQQTLIYNRLPKSGSKGMRFLIAELGKRQNYTVKFVENIGKSNMNISSLARVVDQFQEIQQPWVYIRHIHFIDFLLFNKTTPMYINMIRDPFNRFVSLYYYKRTFRNGSFTGMSLDECVQAKPKECYIDSYMGMVTYFCGHEPFCSNPVQNALLQAKINVIKYFPLVGYLENIEQFLELAEVVWPRFFKDALPVFKDMYKGEASHKTESILPPNNITRAILTGKMQLEYEFYHFIKQRFDCQYRQYYIV